MPYGANLTFLVYRQKSCLKHWQQDSRHLIWYFACSDHFQTVYDDLEVDQKSQIIDFNEAAVIAPICVAVVVVVCIVGVAIFCFKRRCKRVPKENKTSKFYVDNVMCEDAVNILNNFYPPMGNLVPKRKSVQGSSGQWLGLKQGELPQIQPRSGDS